MKGLGMRMRAIDYYMDKEVYQSLQSQTNKVVRLTLHHAYNLFMP